MKVVTWDEFAALPAGTIFSRRSNKKSGDGILDIKYDRSYFILLSGYSN